MVNYGSNDRQGCGRALRKQRVKKKLDPSATKLGKRYSEGGTEPSRAQNEGERRRIKKDGIMYGEVRYVNVVMSRGRCPTQTG